MQWNEAWIMGEARATYVTINQMLEPTRQLDLLRDLGIRIMFESTNRAVLLAKTNLMRGKPLQLDWVQCYSQGLASEDRQAIEQSFGARVIQIYSSSEAGLMGCQCSEIDGFHLNSEMLLVEILDERGQPCPAGVTGRVIVTPFLSTALPLIRYDQSDNAAELPSCRCGSSLPRIGAIAGKIADMLTLPNGVHHLGTIFLRKIGVEDHALAVQIAQVETDAVEFRYVPKGAIDPAWEARVLAAMRNEYYDKLKVLFRPMAQLPLSARGKQRVVIGLAAKEQNSNVSSG
jgi:phenylacetate-CoA ligase